jgi:GAF domain-containing protein
MAKKSSAMRKAIKTGKPKPKTAKRQATGREGANGRVANRVKKQTTHIPTNVKHQLKIQKALYEIANAASGVKNMQSFYVRLHRIVGKLMYAENFFIALYDEQTDLITWPYYVDSAGDQAPASMPLAQFKGGTAYVLRNGRMLHASRAQSEELYRLGELTPKGTECEDWLGTPLKTGKKLLGILVVQSYDEGINYSKQDEEILTFVAQHIATALTRARAIEETRQRNLELAIINSVQEGLASKLDIQGIYELVGDKLYEIFKPDILNIAIYHPETNRTTYPFAIGLGEKRDLPEVELRGFTGEAIRKRQTIVVNKDIEDRSREVGSYNLVKEGPDPQSMVYVPIIAGDYVLGVVSLQSFEHGHIFPESDVRLMETLTSSMSVALQNAQSFKAEQERVAELQIINSIQQGLAAELDFQAIVDLVGDKLREVFKTKDFGIRWYDEKVNLVHFLYEYEHGKRLTIQSRPIEQAPSIRMLRETRQPIIAGTAELGARIGGAPLPGTDLSKSIIIVPIISSDRLMGSLQMEDYERENAYGESEMRLLTTIAASLGTALENARLFDETQHQCRAERAGGRVGYSCDLRSSR